MRITEEKINSIIHHFSGVVWQMSEPEFANDIIAAFLELKQRRAEDRQKDFDDARS